MVCYFFCTIEFETLKFLCFTYLFWDYFLSSYNISLLIINFKNYFMFVKSCVRSTMASMPAFQAGDPGSNPGGRTLILGL